MKDTIITGLDIGSSMIRIVVGQMYSESGERRVQLIGASEHVAEGVTRGSISGIDDAAASITACLEKAERMTGVPIDSAWVGISSAHIVSQVSRGVVAVGKINGEIGRQDVERAVEAARAIATPANYEIVHVIPRKSTIDGQMTIKDPIGMTGTRLEVDTLIVQAFASEVRNVTKCIYRTGLEIEDLVFSILATGEAVLTNKQKELGVVLINIGSTTTSMVVYEEGEILHTAVLPFGSNHITADIAIGLRISPDLAEKIKIEYGAVCQKDVQRKIDIDLADVEPGENGTVPLKYVSHIVEARVEEIFEKVEDELKKIARDGVLPAGSVLTGSGSKLPGMVELAKRKLKLSSSLATLRNVSNPIEKIYDQGFTTAVGLVLWGFGLAQQRSRHSHFSFSIDQSSDISSRVKKWFRSLLP